MNIILAYETKIEVSNIRPNGQGLVIDATAGKLS